MYKNSHYAKGVPAFSSPTPHHRLHCILHSHPCTTLARHTIGSTNTPAFQRQPADDLVKYWIRAAADAARSLIVADEVRYGPDLPVHDFL